MNVICLQEPAFYSLIETVVERLKEKQGSSEDKWISGPEAMKKLRIKSKATLQKMRDEGVIKFSQPGRKIIRMIRTASMTILKNTPKGLFRF